MYLHIGNGEIVDKSDVIGIFDMDTATVSPQTKKFLSAAEKNKEIEYAVQDIPKVFIVCCRPEQTEEKTGIRDRWKKRRKKQQIVFSKISAKTLDIRNRTPFAATDEI